MIALETKRLLLTPFCAQDADDLFGVLGDPLVVRYEPYEPLTRDECALEAVNRADDPAFIAVRLRNTKRLIGNLYFGSRDYGAYELGYVFATAAQGQGYAYESAHALLAHAFSVLNVRRVVAECNPENTRSKRLLERLGFRREGLLIQNIWFRTDENGDPIWQDTCLYGLLRKEFGEMCHAG